MFKKIMVVSLLVGGLAVAGCEVPEEPTSSSEQGQAAKLAKHGKKAKQQKAEPTETTGQENARASAEQYLDMSAFSRSGLIKQLKFEGFNKADAAYAVDAIDPNWNKQAAKSAKQYMDMSAYSASGLQDQLEFEGFTPAQAAFGVAKAGY